jgi:hypothetical protein
MLNTKIVLCTVSIIITASKEEAQWHNCGTIYYIKKKSPEKPNTHKHHRNPVYPFFSLLSSHLYQMWFAHPPVSLAYILSPKLGLPLDNAVNEILLTINLKSNIHVCTVLSADY